MGNCCGTKNTEDEQHTSITSRKSIDGGEDIQKVVDDDSDSEE